MRLAVNVVVVFRVELLTGGVTSESYMKCLQEKDSRIVELERRVHELMTSVDSAQNRCRSVVSPLTRSICE